MGAGLVGRAFAYAVDVPLKPTEMRLLLGMCLTALDADARPRYFDSREASALILGRRVPDHVPDDEDVRLEREAAFKPVKDALRGLKNIGAIEHSRVGGNGRRAEYTIVLDVAASMRTAEYRRRTVGGRSSSLAGGRKPSQLGDGNPPVGGRKASPSGGEEKQEPQEELQRLNETTSLGPVDNSHDEWRAA